VLNGVLWIVRTGAQWRELPEKYPPFQTCHRRFQHWVRTGKFEKVLRLLARHLHEMGKLDLREAFVDATFAGAKKGGLPLVRPDGVRARRSLLSPLTTVFPSRSACKALLRMKASSLKKSLLEAFSKNFQHAWSATGPMTPTHSTEGPKKYPPYQTCHRRFQQWVREGKLQDILRVLAEELHARGKLQLEDAFIDASFTGQKRGPRGGLTKRGKGTKIIALADDHSLPLAVMLPVKWTSASTHCSAPTGSQHFLVEHSHSIGSLFVVWLAPG
jgi:transposase